MARRQPYYSADPSLGIPPASPRYSILGVLAVCLLLAAATWLGHEVSLQPVGQTAGGGAAMRVVDTQRALIFDADPANGDVRVLYVRSGVAEIARLRDPQRHSVDGMTLDPARNVLMVESPNGRYIYDTRSLHLVQYRAALAAGPGALDRREMAGRPVTD